MGTGSQLSRLFRPGTAHAHSSTGRQPGGDASGARNRDHATGQGHTPRCSVLLDGAVVAGCGTDCRRLAWAAKRAACGRAGAGMQLAVGMHGSILALAMFMPAGGALVELFPYGVPASHYTPYRTLAELPHLQLAYRAWEVRRPQVQVRVPAARVDHPVASVDGAGRGHGLEHGGNPERGPPRLAAPVGRHRALVRRGASPRPSGRARPAPPLLRRPRVALPHLPRHRRGCGPGAPPRVPPSRSGCIRPLGQAPEAGGG